MRARVCACVYVCDEMRESEMVKGNMWILGMKETAKHEGTWKGRKVNWRETQEKAKEWEKRRKSEKLSLSAGNRWGNILLIMPLCVEVLKRLTHAVTYSNSRFR